MTQFEYVSVLVSIIVGLGLTQILRGWGRMVTDSCCPKPYWVHLIWTFYLFFLITTFWWWEFRLGTVEWHLSLYLIIIVYATLLFFASLVLQPGSVESEVNFKDYYYSRRHWIFGLLIAIWLWDIIDTLSKGTAHFQHLGWPYLAFNSAQITGFSIAIATANERYHQVFAVAWISAFVSFQYFNFFVLD